MINWNAIICIVSAAVITYCLRVGGLLLSEKLKESGRLKRFMDALPGAILLALVAPGILAAGLWGGIAALSIVFCVRRTGNILLAMLLGMAIIAVQRRFL